MALLCLCRRWPDGLMLREPRQMIDPNLIVAADSGPLTLQGDAGIDFAVTNVPWTFASRKVLTAILSSVLSGPSRNRRGLRSSSWEWSGRQFGASPPNRFLPRRRRILTCFDETI